MKVNTLWPLSIRQEVVFHVHEVAQIHRVSWDTIEKPADLYSGEASQVIGVIKREKDMLLLIDFEKIVVDINPESGIQVEEVKKLGVRDRSNKKVLVAEDSPLLRKLLNDTLMEAGYVNTAFFENGKDALGYLESLIANGKKVSDEIQLVITDIEMPQMDGHHFTKRIRQIMHLQYSRSSSSLH